MSLLPLITFLPFSITNAWNAVKTGTSTAWNTYPYVEVDCETMDAFYGATNCNSMISLTSGDFPVLNPGDNGIGFSTSGYQGPFDTAWTIDSRFYADFITAGTLNGNLIKAGTITDKKGKNYWNMETGEFRLSSESKVGGKTFTEQYQVFLQAYGEGTCYVKERNGANFVVAGDPGLSFGWEIKARVDALASDVAVRASLIPAGKQIYSGDDLNNNSYTAVGTYYCSAIVEAQHISNLPEVTAFMMTVYNPLGPLTGPLSTPWQYRLQEFMPYHGAHKYIRMVSTDGESNVVFGDWMTEY